MSFDLQQIQAACAQRIADAQQRKQKKLASINPQLDPEDYEDAMDLDPQKAMIEISAKQFRQLLGMLPHDCEDDTCTTCTLAVQKRRLGSERRTVTLHCTTLAHVCREVARHQAPTGSVEPAKRSSKAKQ